MRIRKILLVAPEPDRLGEHHPLIRPAKTLFPPLSMMTVAANTPVQYEVSIVNESIMALNYNQETDLVGITANTTSAPRAYEVAAEFRRRGKVVVMGGIHATALPEEASKHVDIVVRGEAEGLWPKVLADLETGNAKPLYEHSEFPNLDNIPRANRSLISPGSYLLPNTIQTTRGCPHRCGFCSVHPFFGGKYRARPIEDIVKEVIFLKKWSKGPIIFLDDNFFGIRSRAIALMKELRKLDIEWFCQASMETLQDDEFLSLAGSSGCRVLFAGLESLSSANLAEISKAWNKPDEMKRTVARLDRHNIAMLAAFIVGLPNDDISAVGNIVDFVQDAQVPLVQIAILTPLPGTECDKELRGDIFDYNYSHRDGSKLVFRHPKITPPLLLEEELQKAYQIIYSRQAVRERFRGKSGPHVVWAGRVVRGYQIRMNKWIAKLGSKGLRI